MFFSENEHIDIPANFGELVKLFDTIEAGSGKRLTKFMEAAAFKYKTGMEDFVWKPSHSIFEFASLKILKSLLLIMKTSCVPFGL